MKQFVKSFTIDIVILRFSIGHNSKMSVKRVLNCMLSYVKESFLDSSFNNITKDDIYAQITIQDLIPQVHAHKQKIE